MIELGSHIVSDVAALEGMYGVPGAASIKKEVAYIHPHYRQFIEAAPFALLATCGPDGLDVSPRGDPAGFVRVHDDVTLLLPDRRGNNRIDSLRNCFDSGRPRPAVKLQYRRQIATLRVGRESQCRVFPVLARDTAFAAVGPVQASGPPGSAEPWNNPGGFEP